MRNALLLLSVWVGIILATYAMVYWDGGGEPPVQGAALAPVEITYTDPDGRFSLIVPSGWTLEPSEARAILTDPSEAVTASVFLMDEEIPESALLSALGMVGDDCPAGENPVEEVAPAGASERAVRIAGPQSGDEASYGLGYLYEGETLVVLVRGSEDGIERVADDLTRIEESLEIPAAPLEEAAPAEEPAPLVEL